jgi:hypothetical protein
MSLVRRERSAGFCLPHSYDHLVVHPVGGHALKCLLLNYWFSDKDLKGTQSMKNISNAKRPKSFFNRRDAQRDVFSRELALDLLLAICHFLS